MLTAADMLALRLTNARHPLFAAEDDARRELAADLVLAWSDLPDYQPPDAVRLDAEGRTEEAHRVRLVHALSAVRDACQPLPFTPPGLLDFAATLARSRAPILRCRCKSRCPHRFTEVGGTDSALTIGQWHWLSSDPGGPDHYKIVAGTKVDPAVTDGRDLTPAGMRHLFCSAPEWARYVQTAADLA
jgi:hypothetical protein